MAAHDEPFSLEAVAHALLLARQDIEAILAREPAWQAMEHLRASSGVDTVRERELVAARLALVPAYRSLKRINDALQGLAVYVAGQSAGRSNSWVGTLADRMPSLKFAAEEFEAEQRQSARDRASTLSGWQSKPDRPVIAGAAALPSLDLDRLIDLIRRGTKDRGPQPLQGLLDRVALSGSAVASPTAGSERSVFPEAVREEHDEASAPDTEAIELVPVRDKRAAAGAVNDEIVVDEAAPVAGPAAIAAAPSSPCEAGTRDRLGTTETEGDGAVPTGSGLGMTAPSAEVVLGEDTVGEIIGGPGSTAAHPAAIDDATISASTGVRRFMSAWSERAKR